MTTNNSEQNGRQAAKVPNNMLPPSDPRTSNLSNQPRPICRKYIWGTCTKGARCKFRHELDHEEMKKNLKFCHDYQNKQGCARIECTYLHASREEENLFRNTGQLPRVLAERYATLSEATNTMPTFEGVTRVPQMMFVTGPPPPPPPLPAPGPAPLLLTAAAPPPPPPPLHPAPVFPSLQQPPPPPPPPTVPPTSVVQAPPFYSGPPQQSNPVVFPPVNQPPPLLPADYDASKPPPTLKRRLECEAGPSKVRKPEGPKVAENPCEICVERRLRIEVYKQEMDKIHCQLKYQSLLYNKNLKDYETGKEILRALVGAECYRILIEHIEGGPPQVQDILAQLSSNPIVSLISECLFSGSRSVVDSALSPSLRLDDTIPSLTSLSRITNPISHPSTDLLHTLGEVLRTSNLQSRAESSNSCVSNNVNGYSRQKAETAISSSPIGSRFPTTNSNNSRSFTPASTDSSSSIVSSAAAVPPPATPAYLHYHPAIPPPPPYYPQPYPNEPPGPPNSASSNSYPSSSRVAGPVAPPMPTRPTSSMAPSMPPNYNHYVMGRYPHPPQYYPPYQ